MMFLRYIYPAILIAILLFAGCLYAAESGWL